MGEDAALSDCPMSVWLRGYYGSQMDLTSIYAKSEELYTALEKDNTIYTMLPVVLTDPNAKAQQGTTAATETTADPASVSTKDSAQDSSTRILLSVLTKKEGLPRESLDLIEAVNKIVEEEEKHNEVNVSSVFQDSKNHSFILIGAVVAALAGVVIFLYFRKNKLAKAAAVQGNEAPKENVQAVKNEVRENETKENGKGKRGKGLKSILIMLLTIPFLTAALSGTMTADSAIAPPTEFKDWMDSEKDGEFQIVPYDGAKKGDPDYVDISNGGITVTQDAYYTSSVEFDKTSGATPAQKTNGMITIAGKIKRDTPLRIYNTSYFKQTITLFLDNAEILANTWCTCAVVQGNAPIELNVIYKGECKMEGYNFAPFAIRERSDVLFNLIKYDSKSSLSLKNAYSNKEMVY